MRLDKWLKTSRLIKRRTVAQEACEGGCVTVNGRTAQPSLPLKEGDTVEITLGSRSLRVEVLSTEENVRKDDASAMYREIAG